MRRVLGWAGGVVLWIVVAFCLTATIAPFFLDRVYYAGPVSDHFDGKRFFNPGGDTLDISPARRNKLLWQQIFGDPTRPAWPDNVVVTPSKPPASVEGERMRVTWIGHASVLVQASGLNILTDPVWSETVGPYGFGPKRVAEPGVRFEDLPEIDIVLVSHNHYDHMDLVTLKRLWDRDHPIIVTSLGNDTLLHQAGIPARGQFDCGDCPGVVARDWGEETIAIRFEDPERGKPFRDARPAVVHVTRSHHWDSRWFADRNRALWSSFVVALPYGSFFFAGDTGLGDGKWPAEAVAQAAGFGIRFAAIPIGAFRFDEGQMASGSHIGPKDAIRVWDGLGRPPSLAVHWGTFRLSREGYATPPRMLRGMMQCAGEDPARFAAHPIGQGFEVPSIGAVPRAPDYAGLDRCIRNGNFDALR